MPRAPCAPMKHGPMQPHAAGPHAAHEQPHAAERGPMRPHAAGPHAASCTGSPCDLHSYSTRHLHQLAAHAGGVAVRHRNVHVRALPRLLVLFQGGVEGERDEAGLAVRNGGAVPVREGHDADT